MTEQEMRILIPQKLLEIEREYGITILHAVESGSRAWDFASPDSDYDVRFIYVRKPEEYLRLDDTRDVLEFPIDDTWDVCGWDLKKALRLLYASNPTLFEWAASPIVYHTTDLWRECVLPILPHYFQPRKDIFHYLSMAHNNSRSVLGLEMIKAKKPLYVLRPLLAARWVMERKAPPPMRFSELTAAYLDPEMKPYVDELLRIKQQMPELGLIPAVPELNAYLAHELDALNTQAYTLPKDENKPWEPLNTLFLDLIYRCNH